MLAADVVERIRLAASSLGYRRDALAAGLRTGRSRLVGVVVPDIANPVFGPILRGIESALSEQGHSVLVANAGQEEDGQAAIVEEFIGRRVDGLILATARRDDPVLSLLPRGRRAHGVGQPPGAGRARLGRRVRRPRRHAHGRRASGRPGTSANRPPGGAAASLHRAAAAGGFRAGDGRGGPAARPRRGGVRLYGEAGEQAAAALLRRADAHRPRGGQRPPGARRLSGCPGARPAAARATCPSSGTTTCRSSTWWSRR